VTSAPSIADFKVAQVSLPRESISPTPSHNSTDCCLLSSAIEEIKENKLEIKMSTFYISNVSEKSL
jgi:hypothetical protein